MSIDIFNIIHYDYIQSSKLYIFNELLLSFQRIPIRITHDITKIHIAMYTYLY